MKLQVNDFLFSQGCMWLQKALCNSHSQGKTLCLTVSKLITMLIMYLHFWHLFKRINPKTFYYLSQQKINKKAMLNEIILHVSFSFHSYLATLDLRRFFILREKNSISCMELIAAIKHCFYFSNCFN